ncbi:hypothetical protein C8R44DRAFT_735240 [Mycena epipterygia]|nr:hypothetical protein C8R44DRAFT_735240 [Mycena epipterygia]
MSQSHTLVRIPGLKVDIYTVSWLFYNFALPYLWDALLTELGMPGMVYAKTQPARPAQPKPSVKPVAAVQPHDGKSLTLSSTRRLTVIAAVKNGDSIAGDNASVHPRKVDSAAETLPLYSARTQL